MTYILKDVTLTGEEFTLLKSSLQYIERFCDNNEVEILESVISKLNTAEYLNKNVK